jgi:regulator of protease activity HflC (stomatin/prohibitin superfamily)
MNTPSRELAYPNPGSGLGSLVFGILLLPASIVAFAIGGSFCAQSRPAVGVPLIILGLLMILSMILIFRGLVLVNPNQSKVVVLFGKYVGTLRRSGFFRVNPFTTRRVVSLRAHNFNSDKLKVNDLRGNPIEIAATVVWRVDDTARASFDVENYEAYVLTQAESALRHLALSYAYDNLEDTGTTSKTEVTLRSGTEEVSSALLAELQQRFDQAGLVVVDAKLTHLAYAPEIAGTMLRRQQAEAVIAARSKIVAGAVGMVEMALKGLAERGLVQLDDERRAAMVSNLLVVLCSDHDAQPVVNTGTLYT